MILIIIKFGEFLLRISLRIINALISNIKHSKGGFHQISKQFEVGEKNSGAPRFFDPPLSVWISHERLFLVFAMLNQNLVFPIERTLTINANQFKSSQS